MGKRGFPVRWRPADWFAGKDYSTARVRDRSRRSVSIISHGLQAEQGESRDLQDCAHPQRAVEPSERTAFRELRHPRSSHQRRINDSRYRSLEAVPLPVAAKISDSHVGITMNLRRAQVQVERRLSKEWGLSFGGRRPRIG